MDRSDLIVAALKEQIGNLSFENAVLRAEVNLLNAEKAAKEKEALAYSKSLDS